MARASVKLYANKSIIVKANDPTSRFEVDKTARTYLEAAASGTSWGVFMLLGFDAFPAALKNQRLYEVKGSFCLYWGAVMLSPLKESFDPDTVTWETKPEVVLMDGGLDNYYLSAGKWDQAPNTPEDQTLNYNFADAGWMSQNAKAFLTACAAQATSSSASYALYVREMLAAGTEPYIEVFYDNSVAVQSQIEQKNSPVDGYVNPRTATPFQWDYVSADSTYVCAGDFTQASAILHWKRSTDANYTNISVSGSTKSVTVPANTFPVGETIEWYLEGTDTAGTTSQTEVYSFSTAAGTATAKLKSPINSVEDGTAPIQIEWTLSSDDGQAPIAVDLEWRLAGNDNWTSLLSHASATTSYTAPGGTFSTGEVQLRVRAYNVDDVAGEWSRPSATTYYSFVCVAAPDPVRGLTATTAPMTTVSWQSTGQRGYEITIDGTVVVSEYGPNVMQWKSDSPLSDGDHVISVRVQGSYSLWSQPTSIVVTIANSVPTEWSEISLAGAFAVDATLTLVYGSADLSEADIYWYRDSKRIGWTTGQTAFVDRAVLGIHSYYAELWDANGNYMRTNSITGMMQTNDMVITAASGGEWVKLSLSDNSESTQSFQYTRTAKLRQMLGAKYPVLELSEFESMIGTYECAFKTIEDAAGLEALRGNVVILKSRSGQVIIGGLISMQRIVHNLYVSYSFSLEQIDWEDFMRYDTTN